MNPTFRTHLEPKLSDLHIDHTQRIYCAGSCFAEHIGKRLGEYLFPSLTNPAGILFHPLAIETSLLYATGQLSWTEDSLTEWQGVWYCWDHHSVISNVSREQLISSIKQVHQASAAFLDQTDICIITLGTAWVYEHKGTGKIVANCHKHPGDLFTKKLLGIDEVTSSLMRSVQLLKSSRPNIRFLFTVSPVRHLKDGFHENQLSKSILLLAIQAVVESASDVYYFPSYEFMMDDLRDYRFYNPDMVHPSDMAVQYIWEAFQKTYMPPDTIALIDQLEKLWQAAKHRPFHPHSAAHLTFLTKQMEALASLQQHHHDLDFNELSFLFQKQLAEITKT